jgi:hypothetical protein
MVGAVAGLIMSIVVDIAALGLRIVQTYEK